MVLDSKIEESLSMNRIHGCCSWSVDIIAFRADDRNCGIVLLDSDTSIDDMEIEK